MTKTWKIILAVIIVLFLATGAGGIAAGLAQSTRVGFVPSPSSSRSAAHG